MTKILQRFLFTIFVFATCFLVSKASLAAATNCKTTCAQYAKTCQDYCDTNSSDSKTCKQNCDVHFVAAKSLCAQTCENNGFIENCQDAKEGETIVENIITDDCLDSCESHYSKCVTTCRRDNAEGFDRITCFDSCESTFGEDGMCANQCELDSKFMLSCDII